MNKYIALDIETGGIGHDKSLLTAYLMTLDENFEPTGAILLETKPKDGIYSITAQALEINGINLIEHDKKAITYQEAGTQLYEFLDGSYDGEKLIPIGHNVAFDIKFLQAKLISSGSWNTFVSYRVLDTGVIAQYLKAVGKMPVEVSGSLGSLRSHFGVEQRTEHTADGDTKMTVDVLKAMLEVGRAG